MITKNDWLAAADDYMAYERERLGELPTPEEVVAYANGELDEPAASRVRAALVYEPALTDLLVEELPENVVAMPPRRASRHWMAIAAMVLLAVTALLVVQFRNPSGPEQYVELWPSEVRGMSTPHRQSVPAGASRYHFRAPVLAEREFASYRVALVRDGDTTWTTTDVQREAGGIVRVTLPGRKLKPGHYVITLHGLGDGEPELLQTYAISVRSPQ